MVAGGGQQLQHSVIIQFWKETQMDIGRAETPWQCSRENAYQKMRCTCERLRYATFNQKSQQRCKKWAGGIRKTLELYFFLLVDQHKNSRHTKPEETTLPTKSALSAKRTTDNPSRNEERASLGPQGIKKRQRRVESRLSILKANTNGLTTKEKVRKWRRTIPSELLREIY